MSEQVVPTLNNGTKSMMGQDSRNEFGMPKLDDFVNVFSVCCSTAVIFGGLVPYIPQYLKIKHSMSSEGFSTYVCLTLLIANILRILFWFGHHFEPPLLIQSFVMIAGMVAMMEICIRVRDRKSTYLISSVTHHRPPPTRRRSIIGKIFKFFTRNDGATLDDDDDDSRPVYTLSSDSSVTSCLLPPPISPRNDGRPITDSVSQAATVAYHEQHITTSTQNEDDPKISISDPKGTVNIDAPLLNGDSIRRDLSATITSTGYSSRGREFEKWTVYKCLNLHNFWNWDNLMSYIEFLLIFTVLLGILTYLLINNDIYIETLGFVAVFTESMLGMPQLLRNYIKKSTRGMSVEMVIMWLPGDIFKTLYFIIRHSPVQFIACGSIQVTLDILILIQVLWYKRSNATYRKLPKST